MWSLGLFRKGYLLVWAINPICASHIQLMPLFTAIKYELHIPYWGLAPLFTRMEVEYNSFQICWREMMRWINRVVCFHYRSSSKRQANQESFNDQPRLWRTDLQFELEFSTFLCSSVLKEIFTAHVDSFRWISEAHWRSDWKVSRETRLKVVALNAQSVIMRYACVWKFKMCLEWAFDTSNWTDE